MRIFIVDDSKIFRERLIDMLSDTPKIEIIGEADNGDEAIESIYTLRPDLVVLDIKMPGKNGIEVLKSIKKNEPAPKVIMLTNYPYPQYRDKCLALGANYFFNKSTELEKIEKAIELLLQNSPD